MKLYDIPAEVEGFEQILIETGGELTPELEQEFSDFIAGSKDKIEAGCFVLRNLEMQQEVSKREARRLSNRALTFERSSERLEGLILYAVDAMGGKVKTALITTWGQNAANRTQVALKEGGDLAAIEKTHPQFVRVKRELNTEAVLDYLEDSRWKHAPLPAECDQCVELDRDGMTVTAERTEHHPICTAELEASIQANLPPEIYVRWVRGVRFLRVK